MVILTPCLTSLETFQEKENNNIFAVYRKRGMEKNPKEKPQQEMKLKEEVYVPTWRAACDAWVTKNVEDKPGVHTPVFRLYNAYIKDNPDDYMDIGQFGKVLRSRFPFRKRRRGKQGQQVYVYQDVALKSELEETSEKGAVANETLVSRAHSPSVSQTIATAGPSILVGNNAGGWLVSSSQPATDISPRASPVKREGDTSHLQSLQTPKRYKVSSDERSSSSAKQAEQDKASSGDEKYANTSLCRMAIGRRWIDANLVDMPGQHTYANDICQAYNEDHPDEPLTFTSLALLIRGKYPGRRKKLAFGNETKFVYEDLKLRESQERKASEAYPIKPETSPIPAQNMPEQRISSPPRYPEQIVRDSITTASASAISCIAPLSVSPENLQFGTVGLQLPVVSVAGDTLNIPAVVNSVVVPNHPHTLDVQNEKAFRKSPVHGVKRKKVVRKETLGSPTSNFTMTREQEKAGMNVSEYLENELLDINDLKNLGDTYTVSIQVPTGLQQTSAQENINFVSDTVVNSKQMFAAQSESDYNYIQNNHPKFRYRSYPESVSGSEGTSDFSESEQSSCIPYSNPNIPVFVTDLSNPRIPISVSDMPSHTKYPVKKSWDHELRKSVSPKIPRGWDLDMDKITTQASTRFMYEQERPREFNEASNMCEYQYYSSAINTSLKEMSLEENNKCFPSVSKEASGSPTSSSPPGPAMHRLAEEIVTCSPQVSEALDLSCHAGIRSNQSASTSKGDRKITKKAKGAVESQFKGLLKSIVSTAKGILENEEPVSDTAFERKIEKAIIAENPAVSYDELVSIDHFPCNIAPALKVLELSTPEYIVDLIRHHQSCAGLGCCSECRTLRAAYIHIGIFQHRCDIWHSFYRIIGKHSKRCRQVSCGVQFCHFVKHELHLNGTSVLPMQLLKERSAVEEEFKKCEELGSHGGGLHCLHFPSPKLPVESLPTKHSMSGRIAEDRENAIANDNKQLEILTQTIVSSFPDTPRGNALGMLVAKTMNLLKDLFKKIRDVR